MNYASVCSGVEAASLAWMPLGWEAVWFSEIEPFPCAVLKERFLNVPNLGDMTKIDGEKYAGTVDLLVGGTPCQGFSVAGKQGGLNDPRSSLCLAYCRLLETMRPRWFVWENVPGVFSTNGGEDFRAFLRKIDEIGYSCAWRVLDAQYVRVDGYPRAVPQRRRRVFVVGYSGDWRYPASVLFEPGCLPGNTPPRRVKGEGVARSLTASPGGASGKEQQHTFISGDGRPLNAIEVMATGQANAETATDHCVNLTCNHEAPIICAGFSGGQGAKAGGIWYQEEVAPTIRSSESGSNQVVQAIGYYPSQHQSPRECETHTLTAGNCNHIRGDTPLVQAIAIAENVIGRRVETGGNGVMEAEEESQGASYGTSFDVNCGCPVERELAHTLTNGTCPGHHSGVMKEENPGWMATVRRLLPVETERLMGFPDNHTRIPWRGKPEEQCPDSPRYKACGNSMCVNVMRWIGMRIEYVERKIGRKARGEE